MVNVLLKPKYCVSLRGRRRRIKSSARGIECMCVSKRLLTNAGLLTKWFRSLEKWTLCHATHFSLCMWFKRLMASFILAGVRTHNITAASKTHFSIFHKWISHTNNSTFQLINWNILTQSIFENLKTLCVCRFSAFEVVFCKWLYCNCNIKLFPIRIINFS